MRNLLPPTSRRTFADLAVQSGLLNFMLRTTALLSVLSLLLYALRLPGPTGWPRLIFGLLLSAVLWLSVLRPHWPFGLRAGLLLVALYLFALGSLLAIGLTDEARIALLVLPVVAMLLIGLRVGTAVGLLSILTVWTAAVAQNGGIIPLVPDELQAFAAAAYWPETVLYFGLMALLAIVTLGRMLFGMDALLREQQALSVQLQEERTALEQRVQARERALQAGVAVSQVVAETQDPLAMSAAIAEQVQRAAGHGRVAIFMLDEKAQRLFMLANQLPDGPDPTMQPAVWLWGEGEVGRAASENSIVSVPPKATARWRTGEDAPASLLAVPIALGERVLGVILVGAGPQPLGQEDMALVMAVASQIASALQNVQAYEWAARDARLQAQVNAIVQHIQATSSVDEALRVTAEALDRVLGAGRTAVAIHSPDRGTAVGEGQHA